MFVRIKLVQKLCIWNQSIRDRFTSEQALRDEYTAGMRVLTDAKKNGHTGRWFDDYNNRVIKRMEEIETELHHRDIRRFVK